MSAISLYYPRRCQVLASQGPDRNLVYALLNAPQQNLTAVQNSGSTSIGLLILTHDNCFRTRLTFQSWMDWPQCGMFQGAYALPSFHGLRHTLASKKAAAGPYLGDSRHCSLGKATWSTLHYRFQLQHDERHESTDVAKLRSQTQCMAASSQVLVEYHP